MIISLGVERFAKNGASFSIDRGLEAYANVLESVNGTKPTTGRISGVSATALGNSGKEWNFYIRDNKLITMYPAV